MRQKYKIFRDGGKNKLKISEYAIIDKDLKKVESSMLQKGDFSLSVMALYNSSEDDSVELFFDDVDLVYI